MSAESFHVCFGIRWEVGSDDEDTIDQLERRTDARQLAAKRYKLDCWWGQTIDEQVYYVLVGKIVAHMGREGANVLRFDEVEFARIAEATKECLRSAGFEDEPAWHFQFEPDR
jgi:hypothetical protein